MQSNSLLSLAEEFSFGSSGSYHTLTLQHPEEDYHSQNLVSIANI